MIDAPQILSQRMVDRYLAGQLSAEEIADFEEYLLEHTEILDQIDATAQLKLGLKTLRARGELDGLVSHRAATRNRYLALAASVLVVLGVGAMYFAQRTAPLLAATVDAFEPALRSASALREVILVRTRDGGRVPIDLSSTPALIVLRIEAGADAAGHSFDVELLPEGAASTGRQSVEGLLANADGVVSVYVDGAKVGAGKYQVVLRSTSPVTDAVREEIFPVELRAPARP